MFMCNTIIFVRLNNVLIKRENQVPVITSLLSTHETSDELYAQVMFVILSSICKNTKITLHPSE